MPILRTVVSFLRKVFLKKTTIFALGFVTVGIVVLVLVGERYDILPEGTSRTVADIAAVLTVVALVLALIQYFDAQRQTSTLKAISESLSTRNVGQFPTYLQVIANMIEKADKSITILCDHPGYGIFSAPDEFQRYSKTIQKKIVDEKEVQLMFLNGHRRQGLHKEQFHRKDDWEKWKTENSERKQLMKRFCNSYGKGKKAKSITHNEFLNLLEYAHDEVLKNDFGKAERWETDLLVPLYFWICDDREAVFSIALFDREARDAGFRTIAFRTEDPNLVRPLKDIFDRYTKQTEKTQKL
jgi:hypothetical protein